MTATYIKRLAAFLTSVFLLASCTITSSKIVTLAHGIDESAGGVLAYIITTPTATYYLEKDGGGLSSMLDSDGVDWLGFHNKKGSGHKGEYRGFPNAVHRQDGNYFHAMNAGTDPSTSVITKESKGHIQIVFTSANAQWEGRWDFYVDRCDFTMAKVSAGYKYWIQYEGVPGGEMNETDYWMSSAQKEKYSINEPFHGDLPAPEWMAFGDTNSPRVLFMLHHGDDELPDDYVSRPDMTVFAFGRRDKEKFLIAPEVFSIGFAESTEYDIIKKAMEGLSAQVSSQSK